MGDWTGTVPSFAAGTKVRASNLQTLADIDSALTGVWTDYVATLTNLTLGNGTVVSRYRRVGKTADVDFYFLLGSTSAVGTTPTFTIPVTPKSGSWVAFTPIGEGLLSDTGTRHYHALGRWSGSDVTIHMVNATVTATWYDTISATAPHTWAATDFIFIKIRGIELA